MKLRRLFAALLAFVLVITASPFGTVHAVTDDAQDASDVAAVAAGDAQTISAVNTDLVLRSNAVKYTAGANFVERGSTTGLYGDAPRIDTLLTAAIGEFNKSGEEWPWIAYKVSVPTAGTYTLGVKTNSCKWDNFKIPMCVNGEVYTLTYTKKAQEVTAEVALPAGEHVVTVFWPMPANESEVYPDADWNTYLWCNIGSLTVDSQLTVKAAPSVAEVEACFTEKTNISVPAIDASLVLRSASVKYADGAAFLERGNTTGLYGDAPRIDTLLTAAPGEFNKAGEEWVWIAYKVSVPRAGTYTLGVKTNSCKWDNFKLPLCVNGEVHTLTYTKKAQEVTAEVTLPAGEHVVTVFWPMPANESEVYPDADWNSYLWCNIESLTVDYMMSVVAAPTAAEVEACFAPKADTVISAIDANTLLWSPALGDNGTGRLEFNQRDAVKADLPYIDSLYSDVVDEFNKSGEEWGWFAYKINVPSEGTYTLGVNTQDCRNASYKIPLCVNNEVYALEYAATGAQSATVEVTLSAGEYLVTMFMPMPQNAENVTGQAWVDYPWCNVQSVVVDYKLTTSKPTVAEVEDYFTPDDTVIPAIDENYLLWSPAVGDNGAGRLEFNQRDAVKADLPYIESLYTDAVGQFNATGEEWGWFAYKINVPSEGTYTLGVNTQDCRNASYKIPLCVNNEVYVLEYAATKAQSATVEVPLPAGEHVVVMFMPMPVNAKNITGQTWVDYPWCNVQSVTVDYKLTVTKPTEAEVEAVFAPKTISAVDTDTILLSATIKKNATALGRTDQATLKVDAPSIETLYDDAIDEFNQSGAEWNWFAYKINVPSTGTYTLGVKTAGSKYVSYKLPLCVNGEVYALDYTANTQLVTTEVTLPAGENVVVMFMPMPANKAAISGNEWNDYHWCDVESVTVPAGVKVTKPTVAEVEACFASSMTSSPLWKQSVLFVGDSITHSGNSWASVIGKAYRMDWTNSGISGATVSDLGTKIIRHQLMLNAGNDYDYVIMHGGMNDGATAVGTVSDSWNVADFDTSTYAGGLETMFFYAYQNYPGAKLGYIVNYATPNADSSKWAGTDDMSAYFAVGKQICEKWGISYIDLYSGKTADGQSYSYDILQVDKVAENFINNDPNEIHLSAAGYNLISPYIAKWMETLTVNTKPAGFGGTHIDANDGDKVLYNNFTPKSENLDWTVNVGLQDRVYTGMAADNANIEYLPYAKDMLGDWAFASIAVDAAQDGQYTFKVEMAAKVPYQIGMLVDGEAYTLVYSKTDGYYQFVEQTVSLTKGKHYITFTAAMPNNDNELDGDAWNVYPWTNIAAIVVDKGLEVLSKPTLEEVTSALSVYEPFYTRVEAEDAEYVIYNNYNNTNEANAKASGGMVVGGAWNSTYKQTFAELETWLNAKGNAYVEYAVVAPADGEYEIRVAYLAGSNDKSIAKPYIAVVVNDTIYKAQFSKNWNQIDKIKLTVTLKEGLNIIRCTSMTTDQEIYGVRGWINQDFIDLDKRLTPVKHSAVTVEAENVKYYNKFKVQAGGDIENASGKVLGSADRKYVAGQYMTLDVLDTSKLVQIPYVSFTVTAPQDGYYPITANMAGDGRLKQSTVGVMVDGQVNIVDYVRTDKTTAGAKVYALLYLTAGDHVITFTTPIPANSDEWVNYSYYWSNYDYFTLYDGLTLAEKQKAPTWETSYARIEAEEYAMFNLNKNNGTAVGNAYYKSSQSIAEMLENGIDGTRTPYAEFAINAKEAGTYVLYVGVSAGMTAGNVTNEVGARFVVDVNGDLSTRTVIARKSTNWTIVPVWVKLNAGENTIRMTHFSIDSHRGGTTWIDFDYIEMPYWVENNLEFVKTGETLEAEENKYSGYVEYVSSSYSGGKYLGDVDYNAVDESDITFEKLDPKDVGELPYVTYRVFAEKAGTYTVTVGFAAGMHRYTSAEVAEGTTAGFAVIVNGETKQLVEYAIASTNTKMSRMVTVELQEGENEITFTTTLAEYIIDHVPYVEATSRKVWLDHDFLTLPGNLSALSANAEEYDINDSDFNHAQLSPDSAADNSGEDDATEPVTPVDGNGDGFNIPAIVWILAGAGAAIILIIILLLKKRKKDEEKV